MSDAAQKHLPEDVAAIKACGYVNWSADDGLSAEFKQHFVESRIPISGIRHVRQWGIQVDDEKEFPGHERTMIEDEELWEIVLVSKDGSNYEVNTRYVVPAT